MLELCIDDFVRCIALQSAIRNPQSVSRACRKLEKKTHGLWNRLPVQYDAMVTRNPIKDLIKERKRIIQPRSQSLLFL